MRMCMCVAKSKLNAYSETNDHTRATSKMSGIIAWQKLCRQTHQSSNVCDIEIETNVHCVRCVVSNQHEVGHKSWVRMPNRFQATSVTVSFYSVTVRVAK